MAATIGIKIANGEFYSIVGENSPSKKRLVLTTVHDRQHSVQIDLYRSLEQSMSDAQYIGSLVVEKIRPKPRGEPSIELIISSTKEGNITAEAIDLDTGIEGESQVLNVSLRTLDEEHHELEIPDFEIESDNHPPVGLYRHSQVMRHEDKNIPPYILVLLVLVLVLGLAALWFFFLGGREMIFLSGKGRAARKPAVEAPMPQPQPQIAAPPPAPELPPALEPPAQEPPVTVVPPPPPVIEAPVAPPPPKAVEPARKRPAPPVASYKVPATIPKGGVAYKIRYGDTLWDISAAFYRTPWLYTRIARYNNIRNPDKIISGRTIRIPPKN